MMGATRRGRTLVFNAARKAWSQFCRFLAGLMIGGHTLVFNAARKALTTVLTVPLPCGEACGAGRRWHRQADVYRIAIVFELQFSDCVPQHSGHCALSRSVHEGAELEYQDDHGCLELIHDAHHLEPLAIHVPD